MIEVLLKGHGYQHDLFELIRVFFPEKELKFIESKNNSGEFLLESILTSDYKGQCTITNIYNKGSVIKTNKEYVDNIKMKKYSEDQLTKITVKKSIFNCLEDFTEKNIPWGILTGIRPLKIVHRLIDNGLSNNKILSILKKDYKIDESKVRLMLNISEIQRKHIYPLDGNRYSIYIGIPFCPTRCSYCSFPTFTIGNNYDLIKEYIDNLLYEIEYIGKLMKGKELNAIYIGGGTPTSIKVKDLERVIETIKYNFPETTKEFTVEAGRPDTINKDMLRMLKNYNVNRISINPQTMNKRTLKIINRNHDIKSIISAYSLAKDIGFDIINMDIILGLPEEGREELKYTLNEIRKLDPENLTVHTLALKRGSKLLKEKKSSLSMKEKLSMLGEVENFVRENSLRPYYLYRQKQILGNLENIGYSKDGKESIYNIVMMEEKETIIGLGLGAVSKIYDHKFDKISRIPNFKSLKDYNQRIDQLIKKKEKYIIKMV